MFMKFLCLLALSVYFITDPAGCQVRPYQTTVNMQVPFIPAVTIISGQRSLYYELRLTNFAKDTLEITNLTVLNAADSSVIYKCNNDVLPNHLVRIGKTQKDNPLALPPGTSGVVFLEFNLPGKDTKMSLTHQIDLNILKGHQKVKVLVTGAMIVITEKPHLIIGPPLAGGPWAAIYDPSWITGHRRVFYTLDGIARLPGRFAIDFIKLDSTGRYAAGDGNEIRNWPGYGTEVLAVRDGVIASVRNDAAESPTLSAYIPASPENATGNYISMKIGDSQYVFYEHLKPGSIRVKPGQKVKKGQVIAAIGFTGQTTGPHLHLHIADSNSPLGAEGVPFEFDYYNLLGRYTDFNNFGKTPWAPEKDHKPHAVTRERPAPNAVIKFNH